MPPSPVEANTSLPGCALARAINSASVRAGTPSPTTRISGTEATWVSSRKSVSGRNGMLSRKFTLMASALEAAMPMVWPSGSALATEAVPVSPPAPARFSITTLLPRRAPILSASTRAKVSAGPPAGNGTTSLMARLGNSSAEDARGAAKRRARRHTRRTGVRTERQVWRICAHMVGNPDGDGRLKADC